MLSQLFEVELSDWSLASHDFDMSFCWYASQLFSLLDELCCRGCTLEIAFAAY
jgi:hypothetical protein